MGQPRKGRGRWQHAKTFVAKPGAVLLPFAESHARPEKGPQALAHEVDRPGDPSLHPGLHLPDAAFPPAGAGLPALQDMRDRADVIRLLKAGYQRVAIEASRPVEGDRPGGRATSLPAPGGLPRGAKKDADRDPPPPHGQSTPRRPTRPRRRRSTTGSTSSYTTGRQQTPALRERTSTSARGRSCRRRLRAPRRRPPDALPRRYGPPDIPPGSLRPGKYRVTLVGEQSSRSWSLDVR